MYFAGVSSLLLIGHSGPSRFWARLLIDVSTMIDVANAARTSSQSFAVDFIGAEGRLIDRRGALQDLHVPHELGGEPAVVRNDIVARRAGIGGLGAHQRNRQSERNRSAHNHGVADL